MPVIVLPRRHTAQPNGNAQIDFDHPFLAGVRRLWSTHEGQFREYIYQRAVAVEMLDRPGLGYSGNFSVNNAVNLFGTEGACLSGDITVFAVVELSPTGGNQSIVGRNLTGTNPAADTSQFALCMTAGNQAVFSVRDAGVGAVVASSSGYATGRTYVTVLVGRVRGTDVALFANGRRVGTGTLTGALATTTVTQQYHVGNNPNVNGNFAGYASLIGVLDRAASDNEIAQFSDNPWALFRSHARTMFFGAGLTAVTADTTARWSMLSAVEKTQAIRWSLLMATSRDATVLWNMLAAASKSATIRWNMIAALSADATLRWSLVQAVSADATLRWSMLKAISSDVTLMWDMAGATGTVSRDIAVRWSMLAAVHTDATLHWSMLQAIAREATLSWDMTRAIARDATLRWNMLRAVSANFTAAWNMLQAVSADATLAWDMAAAFGKVSSSVDVRWNMLAAVQRSIDVRWDMLAAVGADAEMRWDMLSAVMSEATVRWDALAATGNEVTVSWDMLSAVENEIAIRWRVGDPSLLSSFVVYTVPRERRTSIIPPELRSFIVPKPQRREALMTT